MYYTKIDEFIKSLNKDNIEELQPKLIKYVHTLILSIKDEDDKLSADDIDKMITIVLAREEIQDGFKDELESKNITLGLLTHEFMNTYKKFTTEIYENGYITDAIDLSRDILRVLGCTQRDFLLVAKYEGSVEEKSKYLTSTKYLEDLQKEIYEHLSQYKKEFSREQFIILGLVNFIKFRLKEHIRGIGETFLVEFKNKSLDDFSKQEHTPEYRAIISKEYIKELNRRIYSWNVLSPKFEEDYFIDELYKDLE